MGTWVLAQMVTIKERGFLGCATLKSGEGNAPSPVAWKGSARSEPSAGLPPLATHPIQLQEGIRSPRREVGQHADVSCDGDCGLLFLECDRGCLLHLQPEQELLAPGHLPQDLERGREQGPRQLMCPTDRVSQ